MDTIPVLVCYTLAHPRAHTLAHSPLVRYTLVMMMRILMKQCGRISVRTHKLARCVALKENENRESNIITVLYIFRNVIRHYC